MTNLKDIAAGILELQVYHGILPGGAPMELAITLLDVTNDALPLSKTMRDHGAQAYGMLFFKSASPSMIPSAKPPIQNSVIVHGP